MSRSEPKKGFQPGASEKYEYVQCNKGIFFSKMPKAVLDDLNNFLRIRAVPELPEDTLVPAFWSMGNASR